MKKLLSILSLVLLLVLGSANAGNSEFADDSKNPLIDDTTEQEAEKASCPGGNVGGGGSCTG